MNLKITRLFVFFTFFTAIGQETYQVSGNVVASNSETAIVFANAVLAKDGTVVKGGSTDASGTFVIANVSTGKYILNISFLGYKRYIKEITITANIDLGTIILQKDTESLSDVTISSKKPVLKHEVDRLVFNVAETALTEDNIWEILRKTPGVIVIDNTLSVKNSTPTVYINNKKVHLSANEVYQLLEGTSAQNVNSIEVITNPPVSYDAQDGTVLNIVMSENLILGYNGSMYGNFTQGVFPRYNAGMNHFYKRGKLNIFGGYSYTHNKINRDNEERIHYLDDNRTTSIWNSDINRNTRSDSHNVNLNIDYKFNAKNTLSFAGSLLHNPYWKRKTLTNTTVDDQTVANRDFLLKAINRYSEDKHNLALNIDYVHYFEKEGEKLSTSVHYTDYDRYSDQHVFSDYTVISSSDFTTAFTTNASQKTNIISGQIDYEVPLSKSATLEAGAKVANIETDSNLWQFNILNGVPVLDVVNSDTFKYDESIYAGYISYAKNWEKWSVKVGVRGEHTELKGNTLATNQVNTQNYFELFPTAYVNHKISKKLNVHTEYSRKIKRPSFDNLNPFQFNFTDFSFASGNPRLQPSIFNTYKIGLEIDNKFFIEAYHKYKKAPIFELTLQDNDNDVLQYVATNIEKSVEYGLDFITYFSITNTWNVSFVTSFFNNGDSFTLPNNTYVSQSKWSNYTSIDNNFTFLKDKSLTANLSLLYISANIQGLSEVSNRSFVSLAFRKTLWNKKATVSLSANDIFNGQKFTNNTIFANQNSSYNANIDTQTVRIGFRYNFGNTKLRTNQRTKSSAEQERLKE